MHDAAPTALRDGPRRPAKGGGRGRSAVLLVAAAMVFGLGVALGHVTASRGGAPEATSEPEAAEHRPAVDEPLRLVATSGSGQDVVVAHRIGQGRRVKYEVPSGWSTFVPAPPTFASGVFRVFAGPRTMMGQSTDSVRCRVYDHVGNLVADTTVTSTYESAECRGF